MNSPTSGEKPRSQAQRGLAWLGFTAFFALSAATFAVASFVPIYTDEIDWKITQGRYVFDLGQVVSTLPMCSVSSFDVPIWLKPYRLFDTATFDRLTDPFSIRAFGVVVAAIWGVLLWTILRNGLKPGVPLRRLAALVIGFATLGLMPFFLFISRPEQILLIGITIFAVPVILGLTPRRRSLPADIGLAVAVLVFAGYFFDAHPRALFALPMALIFIVRLFARKAVAIGAGVGAALWGVAGFADWSIRTQCDWPSAAAALSRDSILVAYKYGKIGEYYRALHDLLVRSPDLLFYFSQFRFDRPVTSNMIPASANLLATTASVLSETYIIYLVLLGAAAFVWLSLRAVRARRIGARELMLASLWAFYAASVVSRATRNTYEATLMEPLMVIAGLGSLWSARDQLADQFGAARLARATRIGFTALVAVSAVSQMVLLVNYLPYASGSWVKPGYVSGQSLSVSSGAIGSLKPKIVETARMCGIDPAQHPRHVIVDELTYFALQPISQTFLAVYIDENHWGVGIKDYRGLLRSIGSGGMVVGCQWIPTQLRGEAVRNGEFCCLPKFAP